MIKNIIKHGSFYFSASIFSAGVSFLMTKYYTFSFSPSDFGIMTLYVLVFEYISIMGTLSTEKAVSRKIFDYHGDDRSKYLSSILYFYAFSTLCILVFAIVFANSISEWILPGSYDIYVFVVICAGLSVFYKFFYLIIVNEEKSKLALHSSIIQTTTSSSVSIMLISLLSYGIMGRFIAQAIGSLVYLFILGRTTVKLRLFKLWKSFDFIVIKETIILAFPMMSSTVIVLLFSYVDRLFLKSFSGDHSVGLYGLALIVGKLINLVFDSLSTAFFPTAMNSLKDDYEKGIKEIELLSYKYYFFLLIIFFLATFLSPYIIELISNDSYSETNAVMPFIFLGIVSGGSYKISLTLLTFHKIVWFYPILALFSFSVNAILNYLLIPSYGIVGAGFATFLGYIIYSFVIQVFSFKYFPFKYGSVTVCYYLLLMTISLAFLYENNNFF